MADTVTVGRDGKRWAIYVNGKLVEGGFWTREAALGQVAGWVRDLARDAAQNAAQVKQGVR